MILSIDGLSGTHLHVLVVSLASAAGVFGVTQGSPVFVCPPLWLFLVFLLPLVLRKD
ncbi:hypothetical protein [Mycobacterium uberis]|uniref:hypothetical protein n=1 Tax=Mycobacterium uberis TaxID=2162698 RepID=UPI0014034C3E|nr:hypothetical protein [Mycobacterium uberis]